jgi:hypothetical protein
MALQGWNIWESRVNPFGPKIYFVSCIVLVLQVNYNLIWLSLQTPAGANTMNIQLLVMGSIKCQLEQRYCANYWIIWIQNLRNLFILKKWLNVFMLFIWKSAKPHWKRPQSSQPLVNQPPAAQNIPQDRALYNPSHNSWPTATIHGRNLSNVTHLPAEPTLLQTQLFYILHFFSCTYNVKTKYAELTD